MCVSESPSWRRCGVCGWLAEAFRARAARGTPSALALFSASGGMLMATSADLITFYMALELSTMPAYVLIGYRAR